jgi:hypothetical protein
MTALTTLILLAGMASAETTTLTGLASKLRDLNKSTGEAVLLGAAGPEAEKALQRLQRDNPAVSVEIVRVPTVGDVAGELERALEQADLSCALRVAPLGPSSWEVASFGDCRSRRERPVGGGTSGSDSTLSALAALSEAVSDDGGGKGPVTSTPTPSAPSTATDDSSASAHALPESRAVTGEELLWAASTYAQGPDPVVALLDSTLFGFGAGHFYSGNDREGRVHLGVQLGSLALGGAGVLLLSQGVGKTQLRMSQGMVGLGGVGFTVGRIADIYRAPISAHDARARNLGGR